MSDSEDPKAIETDLLSTPATGPLVFISHDARDAELAEAFSKLLKSISAGMIKTFRSSDKKGTEGIDFGEEWFKRLMQQLQSTSDVVCLFTERSLDRPWILFEAGVAKGKLSTPVVGVALGVPMSRVTAGPFYQFQNMTSSEDDLTKLVNQLARRVSNLELDADVVKSQVTVFKTTEAAVLSKLAKGHTSEAKEDAEEITVAKLVEEIKALPSRIAERLSESGDVTPRRRIRRIHPMMIEELFRKYGDSDDPIAILMIASVMRDDAPWLYELALEVYRAAKSGDIGSIEREINRIERFSEIMFRSPFAEEFALGGKEFQIIVMEFPRFLQRMLRRRITPKQVTSARRIRRPDTDEL